jgi:hypothetical protein
MLLIGRTFMVLHLMGTRHLHLRQHDGGSAWSQVLAAAMTTHRGNTLYRQQNRQQPDADELVPGLHGPQVFKAVANISPKDSFYITASAASCKGAPVCRTSSKR